MISSNVLLFYTNLAILIARCTTQPLKSEVHINAGGDSIGIYSSDAWKERPDWIGLGGQSETLSPNNVWMLGEKNITIDMEDSPPNAVFQSFRFGYMDNYNSPGPFQYNISELQNGYYTCKLYFVEHKNIDSVSKAGQRVFSVNINGATSGSIDIFKAKGIDEAFMRTIKGVFVKENTMTIKFIPQVNKATISAVSCSIENTVKKPALKKEVKINAGGDESGEYKSDLWNKRPSWIKLLGQSEFANPTNTWQLRGKNFPLDECVAPNSSVFQSYRFGYTKNYRNPGPFAYEISEMSNGIYGCKLYFVEILVSKPRKRKFTAKIQSMETSTIDIFAEKGQNAVLSRSVYNVNVTKNIMKIMIKSEVNNPVLSALHCKNLKAS